ncbi:hypothetical protein SCP_0504530 [Sparassis crispa]|uniref:Uncharacterized protein n=1 Tax=Sparassis crispa TaxID=139825 RepID=A0A401GMG7_9APHY|nr:hypothetical protein SCP_0504530 [Sparassis crispa]GBE83405.1 hypothetical protein SCP_0504530 [Sparassis crispa]
MGVPVPSDIILQDPVERVAPYHPILGPDAMSNVTEMAAHHAEAQCLPIIGLPGVPSPSTQPGFDSNEMRSLPLVSDSPITSNNSAPSAVCQWDAAFDRRERPSIVLAKNAPPTLEDEHAAQRFITDPENDDAVEFFAILLLRYRANMNRRLLNLHKYIAEPALLEDFRSALSLYKTMSITKECPNSTDLRSDQYPNGEPSFRTMLGDIIDKLQALSAFQLGEVNFPRTSTSGFPIFQSRSYTIDS